jgi:UDP-glucuronate 4-epimerase
MTDILITGGAGFIGSHVCEALLARGDRVTVLDNFNDFYDPAIKRGNAERLVERGARLVEGDIRDEALLDRLLVEDAPDAVIHLAAMAGVRPSLLDPLHYEDVNVRATLLMLERLKQRPTTRFVFASSSSVYGANEKAPFSETDDIHQPISPYAATKRAGELHCFTYHHLYAIPTSCLRFFTVYGPRQRPEMAIHKFVAATLERRPITMFGDGSTRRDYTYVADIVDGVVKALDHCAGYEIYNLGESQTVSLAEMIEEVGRACGVEPIVERSSMQPGDVLITYADVSKAKERLGYAPSTDIRTGLEHFVDWYRTEGPGASLPKHGH